MLTASAQKVGPIRPNVWLVLLPLPSIPYEPIPVGGAKSIGFVSLLIGFEWVSLAAGR
jgi:hypothetical protein